MAGTASVRRLLRYFAIRFVPTALVSSVLYAMCLADVSGTPLRDVVFQRGFAMTAGWSVADEVGTWRCLLWEQDGMA